jgi:hypothetical protein
MFGDGFERNARVSRKEKEKAAPPAERNFARVRFLKTSSIEV